MPTVTITSCSGQCADPQESPSLLLLGLHYIIQQKALFHVIKVANCNLNFIFLTLTQSITQMGKY